MEQCARGWVVRVRACACVSGRQLPSVKESAVRASETRTLCRGQLATTQHIRGRACQCAGPITGGEHRALVERATCELSAGMCGSSLAIALRSIGFTRLLSVRASQQAAQTR